MVAYNFQKRFVPAIRSGAKTHTIRRYGKRRHARVGEKLQLYTGLRTAYTEKILATDPTCTLTVPIAIGVGEYELTRIELGTGSLITDFDEFARADGFKSAADMFKFWLDFHGIGTFNGCMIHWGQP